MKKLFLFAIGLLFLVGCSKAQLMTPRGALDLQNGNKIYAYKDADPSGEHTTIIVARVDGPDAESKLAAIMKQIKEIFNHE